MSASRVRDAWFVPIARPNCLRSLRTESEVEAACAPPMFARGEVMRSAEAREQQSPSPVLAADEPLRGTRNVVEEDLVGAGCSGVPAYRVSSALVLRGLSTRKRTSPGGCRAFGSVFT